MKKCFLSGRLFRSYFRKSGQACATKKGHIWVNLGQFADEAPLNIHLSFWSGIMSQKIRKGHCGQVY